MTVDFLMIIHMVYLKVIVAYKFVGKQKIKKE
jgi:hypothetical protein